MDGAGTFQMLLNVILPLSRPALATVAIFTFQAAWNDILGPLIFLHNQSLYTLQLGLSLFRGAYNVQWAYLMAATLVVTLPVFAVFFIAHRSFIEGVGFTAIKI
jgi:multiple sugar transport system permease protein